MMWLWQCFRPRYPVDTEEREGWGGEEIEREKKKNKGGGGVLSPVCFL